ncbi:hypothetical protein CDO44_17210 [Pigmentiphaga sp. NML080357]|uniref:DUF1330 domain-containing protein n=1 Tax=Pigmentiphaga sp. NML080357 TaxID=2008675 RepID=UPI000B413838|nr:DUF1330 domain-containing protein [Pigmentiphaga sp. NML080357]OVZ57502.1 hypothetical protein CDO44_17210 [Pigmentiphaga sp. NML080357]
MSAYWLARSRVIDPVRYLKYAEQVPAIIEKYGARVLSRGAPFVHVEGASHFTRFVVLEFPSLQHALDCYHSPEYQRARQHRLDGAGEAEITLLEAGEFTSAMTLEHASNA